MKTFSLKGESPRPDMFEEAARVLEEGKLICLPCGGTYRVLADISSYSAVMRLFQSKRRTRDAPTLVFVSDESMLQKVAKEIDLVTQRLIDALWPGGLTILIEPELDLPRKMIKRMCKKRGKIGVRVPGGEVAQGVLDAFGGPLLVSSANIEKKRGAYSSAQVRKNFFGAVELFFDDGDLKPVPASTIVDVNDGEVRVIREGVVATAEVEAAATGSNGPAAGDTGP
jgi:L-threonylcarbamoyladenylate synthase